MFTNLYNRFRPQYALTWSFAVKFNRPNPHAARMAELAQTITQHFGGGITRATTPQKPPVDRAVVRHATPILTLDDFPSSLAERGVQFSSIENLGICRLAIRYDDSVEDLLVIPDGDQLALCLFDGTASPSTVGWLGGLTRSQKAIKAWTRHGKLLGAPAQELPRQIEQLDTYQDSILTQITFQRRLQKSRQ